VQSANDNGDASAGGSGVVGSGAKTTSTGFEAGAMEEGFYQHDVAAEDEAFDLVPMNSSTMMMLM
jgi:hypothetical protein